MDFNDMKCHVLSMIAGDGNAWLSGALEKVRVSIHQLKVMIWRMAKGRDKRPRCEGSMWECSSLWDYKSPHLTDFHRKAKRDTNVGKNCHRDWPLEVQRAGRIGNHVEQDSERNSGLVAQLRRLMWPRSAVKVRRTAMGTDPRQWRQSWINVL